MIKRLLLIVLCLAPLSCNRQPPAASEASGGQSITMGDRSDSARAPTVRTAPPRSDYLQRTHWPPATLESGTASVSCNYDYVDQGDGIPITSLEFLGVADALAECRSHGVVRLRYEGKINAGFTALVERVGAMATRMEIETRILDIDSAGGHVEEAIKAGDAMAAARWDIWVRENSLCHSACVLVLAAGDTRSIAGKVGIHRLMRIRSTATSRAELSAELKDVSQQVRDYLERNGVASAVADLMMTVPNRDLRLLDEAELKLFGLDGTNAAQADLDRIIVMRKCGEEFVRRKDAFGRAFDRQCMEPGKAFEDKADCGLALRARFGFPDKDCPAESPMAEHDRSPRQREPQQPATG